MAAGSDEDLSSYLTNVYGAPIRPQTFPTNPLIFADEDSENAYNFIAIWIS